MFNSVALGLGVHVALLCFVTSTVHPPPTPYQSGAVDSALQPERRNFRATDCLFLPNMAAVSSGKESNAGRFLRPLRNYELQSGAPSQ
jgi:hypothetical protein